MTRKTISVDEDLHADLQAMKQDGESWPDLLRRLADDETDTGQRERTPDALTEEHIDDIAAAVSQRTADELETRLR